MKITKILLAASFVFSAGAFSVSGGNEAFAHERQLDTLGCHYARGHRDYHCHEGKLKGRVFQSRAEAIRNYNRLKRNPLEEEEDDDGKF